MRVTMQYPTSYIIYFPLETTACAYLRAHQRYSDKHKIKQYISIPYIDGSNIGMSRVIHIELRPVQARNTRKRLAWSFTHVIHYLGRTRPTTLHGLKLIYNKLYLNAFFILVALNCHYLATTSL